MSTNTNVLHGCVLGPRTLSTASRPCCACVCVRAASSPIHFRFQRRGTLTKSRSLDDATIDLRRQLEAVEQEAQVLKDKVEQLDRDNDKLIRENRRLQLLAGRKVRVWEGGMCACVQRGCACREEGVVWEGGRCA